MCQVQTEKKKHPVNREKILFYFLRKYVRFGVQWPKVHYVDKLNVN